MVVWGGIDVGSVGVGQGFQLPAKFGVDLRSGGLEPSSGNRAGKTVGLVRYREPLTQHHFTCAKRNCFVFGQV